jgi:hypothetical protein
MCFLLFKENVNHSASIRFRKTSSPQPLHIVGAERKFHSGWQFQRFHCLSFIGFYVFGNPFWAQALYLSSYI